MWQLKTAYILGLQFSCPTDFKPAFICLGFINIVSQGASIALNWYNLLLLLG